MPIHYERNLIEAGHYDVAVVGSGPAGICAAVAAARQGMKTVIIERCGVLGGMLTVGNVGPILGNVAPGTMYDELSKKLLTESGMLHPHVVHDMEHAKKVILDFVCDAGVDVLEQTDVVDTIVEENVLTGIIISWKGQISAITADRFIDATGDGNVAFEAGVPWKIGRESDGKLQPVTLMYIVQNVDESQAITCFGEDDEVKIGNRKFLEFTQECVNKGILPKNCYCVRLYRTTHSGERLVNTSQVNDIDPLDPRQCVKAEKELRRQEIMITEFLRKYVPGFSKCTIKIGASTLGIRESRRIVGEYILNIQDLRSARKFPDVVVHNACFVVDIHNPDGGGQQEGVAEAVRPYDIPYRCLVPLEIENLIIAGRCISSTHEAQASFRVMSICMAIGEAAGIAAAQSILNSVTPRKLKPELIQQELMTKGAVLFDEQ
ncbi:MAG: FAD-dependent oxidoreductase [Lachnospiraceae bacterium]|nr:FAD-dependent oxidoreductase [Lachnospiraceae bacterium]MDY6333634.1 FAD-dependent oxidoreductase [Lachnospiraceae bacterium]